MGGTTAQVVSGRSLLLKTETGPIVFLNTTLSSEPWVAKSVEKV